MPSDASTANSDAPSSPLPSSPLRDSTNTTLTPAEIEAMKRDLENLRGLLKGVTKKRARGRKRVGNDGDTEPNTDDQEPTAKKKRKSDKDTATDYVEYGRVIGRFLGPFVNISKVIRYGLTADAAMSGDEGETDARLDEDWKILWGKFPGFHEYLLSQSTEPTIIRAMTKGMESSRQQDTSTVKTGIVRWLHKDPTTPLDPPLPNIKSKTHRGMAHPTFAQRLTPIEWAVNEETFQEIVEGKKVLESTQLPAFIFPLDQVFTVGTALDDPIWGDVFDNALKGEILLRAAKAIFMGPSADLEVDGYHKGRPGNASIIGLDTFTPRVISGVVYFGLSSMHEWNKKDGVHFDYEDFFWTIHGLFDDDEEWGKGIIALWDRVVLGKCQPAPAVVSGPSALEQLKAARAARAARPAASS
ncbi:hypothetical protein C8R45DRAFT_1159929 [Mycena sanguinolenta]|nr:hypothetical protein C8R45DRAFT_1159929 [Mycena sanguinolenta]